MSDTEDRGSAYSFQLLQKKVDKVALAALGLTDEMCDMVQMRRLAQKAWADGYRQAYRDEIDRIKGKAP